MLSWYTTTTNTHLEVQTFSLRYFTGHCPARPVQTAYPGKVKSGGHPWFHLKFLNPNFKLNPPVFFVLLSPLDDSEAHGVPFSGSMFCIYPCNGTNIQVTVILVWRVKRIITTESANKTTSTVLSSWFTCKYFNPNSRLLEAKGVSSPASHYYTIYHITLPLFVILCDVFLPMEWTIQNTLVYPVPKNSLSDVFYMHPASHWA